MLHPVEDAERLYKALIDRNTGLAIELLKVWERAPSVYQDEFIRAYDDLGKKKTTK